MWQRLLSAGGSASSGAVGAVWKGLGTFKADNEWSWSAHEGWRR